MHHHAAHHAAIMPEWAGWLYVSIIALCAVIFVLGLAYQLSGEGV